MPSAELRRRFDWWLQNRLTGSAPVLKRHLASLAQLEAALSPAQQTRYHELAARYPLAGWPTVCTRREAQINLWVLDVLDRHVPRPGAGRCLDIGAGGWSYLPPLASFAGAVWDGIELDAHGMLVGVLPIRYQDLVKRQQPDRRYLLRAGWGTQPGPPTATGRRGSGSILTGVWDRQRGDQRADPPARDWP